ncbi:UDP-glucosyltransferase 2-like isoform X2 [Hetaerina americana]|uniref:UDP-glucosyltransferase 2-like isoform X2 n=1 Tax=Hetaerina americana TaxID=62018 RepID=UPI003A7F2F34
MGFKLLICACATLQLISGVVDAARILALVPTPSKSHHIWNSALMLGLAKRGHQITALSPDPPMENLPNLKHMILEIPMIGITAFGIGPWTDILTGARTLPSVFPLPILPYLSTMNMWERLYNTIVTGTEWAGMYFYYLPKMQRIAESSYGKPLPSLTEIGSNISLILVNNHFALIGPQAQLPGIVEVGAMQCSPPKALPKDINSFLDGAKRGAIFFSLGSNLRSEELPKENLQIIIDTFAALGPEIRVLWKFDPKVEIKGLPSNVLIKKWFPQEDVLGHPKILAFVSHAGLLSTTEALYHGKPVVAVPFFVDQHTNAKRMVEMKVAEHVDFLSITKETFTKKILNVINDPSYHHNVRKISNLIRDQPETPLDRAIFWVEFILRQGTGRVEALRSAGLDLAWYQYFLLDVLAIIFSIVSITTLVAAYVICTLYRLCMKSSHKEDSKVKSKKKQ